MPAAAFLAPHWLLVPGLQGVRVRDLSGGEGFDVAGDLADQLLQQARGVASSVLRAMGALDATVARFAEDYRRAVPVPLSRGALLRGSGFEQLFVELTARCNERCGHCYASASPERHEQLPWELIDQALVDARQLGFRSVQLTGGDPLIADSCAPAARRVRELGFERLEVYTNGLALRGALYATLRDCRADLAFSFYAADPRLHDAMTGTAGSQRRTLSAIARAARDGLRVRASVVVTERNAHCVAETVAALRKAGVPAGAIAVSQERGVGRGRFDSALRLEADGPHAFPGPGRPALAGKAAIAPDGTVYPCIFGRSLPLGSLHKTPLHELLDDPAPLAVDLLPALEHAAAWGEQLSCWECRVRAAVLVEASQAVPLLSLRPKSRAHG